MAKTFIGDLDVGRNATAQSKNLARTVNGVPFDSTNNVQIDAYTKEEIDDIISVLPLSQYVASGNVNSTGFVLHFADQVPVMLSGKSFLMDIIDIDLTTIKPNPASTTFYVYVQMVQGNAIYVLSETVIAESGASAYNTLWIGTIQTNTTQISTINIIKRSRLDVFGPSVDPAGSSFPVSTGLPSQTGTISW